MDTDHHHVSYYHCVCIVDGENCAVALKL